MSASLQIVGSPGTALSKAQYARGYQQAYFLLKELAATQAHLLTLEGWEVLMRAQGYCGWRYNSILLGETAFAPKDWRARR